MNGYIEWLTNSITNNSTLPREYRNDDASDDVRETERDNTQKTHQ